MNLYKNWLTLCCCCTITLMASSQDLFDSLRTAQYARHLYQSGSYNEAIDELERFVFLFESDIDFKLRLVQAYRRAGREERAGERMNQLWDTPPNVSAEVAKEFFALRILNQQTEGLERELEENPHLTQLEMAYFSSVVQMKQGRFSHAYTTTSPFIQKGHSSLEQIHQLATQGENLRFKSPWVSGVLSTVIPSSGKFYTGNYTDGILSLVMIGSSAFQSYRGFSQNGMESVYGWIFGSIATGFYIGNITGSIKAAHRYNVSQSERIQIRVQAIFLNSI